LSEIFGEKLRNRRLEKGLTLEALAEKIGSTKAYVWQRFGYIRRISH
jgi:transcriptional regulator with XRE-family HTH domain